MLRATSILPVCRNNAKIWASTIMTADERHLRRKLISLDNGSDLLVDLPKPVKLDQGDCLVLEDGRLVIVIAAVEDLLEVKAEGRASLARLAWHIGNRHLGAQIDKDRILLQYDPVIAAMLEGLGASVRPVRASFSPEHGAYHSHPINQPHHERSDDEP